MSLRQQGKILGVHHTLLSKCLLGQRKWNPELKERYDRLVSTLPNNGDNIGDKDIHSNCNHHSRNTPYTGTKNLYNNHSPSCGAVAHLGERFNGIEEVGSSILPSSTIIPAACLGGNLVFVR